MVDCDRCCLRLLPTDGDGDDDEYYCVLMVAAVVAADRRAGAVVEWEVEDSPSGTGKEMPLSMARALNIEP